MSWIAMAISESQELRHTFSHRLREADRAVEMTVNVQIATLSRGWREPLGRYRCTYRGELTSTYTIGESVIKALSESFFILVWSVGPTRVPWVMGLLIVTHSEIVLLRFRTRRRDRLFNDCS